MSNCITTITGIPRPRTESVSIMLGVGGRTANSAFQTQWRTQASHVGAMPTLGVISAARQVNPIFTRDVSAAVKGSPPRGAPR